MTRLCPRSPSAVAVHWLTVQSLLALVAWLPAVPVSAEDHLSYHSQLDTLDKAREPDLIQGAQAMAVIAVRVANLPGLLPRDKPAKKAQDE